MGKSSTSTATSDGGRKNCYRGHWRPAEDEKLRQLVERYGPQNWNFIAEHLGGRSGKSCRLRWYNQLDPNISKKPFTEEEEEKLLSAHRIYGNKWACIAKYFHGRTDNAVKNHYHVVMARRKRERYNRGNNYHNNNNNNPSSSTTIHIHSVYDVSPKLGFPKFQSFGCHNSTKSSDYNYDYYSTPKPSSQNHLPLNNIHGGYNHRPKVLIRDNYIISGSEEVMTTDKNKLVRLEGNMVKSEKYLGVANPVQEHNQVPFIDFLGVGLSLPS